MAASDDLMQNVYDYFLKSYHEKTTDAKGGEFIAFERGGFAPGCVSSADTGASAALQEVSRIADVVPAFDADGYYMETLRTFSFQYSVMISAAEPVSAAAMPLFSSGKSQAGKLYQDATSNGELDGPKATFATPSDWWDLRNTGNWNNFSYDTAAQASSPPPPPPPGAPPPPRLMWRVLRPDADIDRIDFGERPPNIHTVGVATPIMARTTLRGPQSIAFSPEATTVAFAPAAAAASASPAVKAIPVSLVARTAATQLVAQTTPQPVESTSFKISFQYCLVRLRRPWLSGDFLAMSGWYYPGAHAGDYASGPPANTGSLAALPTAFIAVKNLSISGSFSANDLAAAGKSPGLGPFAVAPGGTAGTLTNMGVQIIGWIFSPQPKLPPNSDPELARSA